MLLLVLHYFFLCFLSRVMVVWVCVQRSMCSRPSLPAGCRSFLLSFVRQRVQKTGKMSLAMTTTQGAVPFLNGEYLMPCSSDLPPLTFTILGSVRGAIETAKH